MPNWIEGTLKLRGNSEDLKRFFDSAIQPCASHNPKMQKREDFIKCDYEGGDCVVSLKRDAWVSGTARAFVAEECDVYWNKSYDTVCIPIRQAWVFVPENWEEISKKYNIDVRLYGFECGMEFCQELEIIAGKLTMDNEIKYADWDWECPMPLMGG